MLDMSVWLILAYFFLCHSRLCADSLGTCHIPQQSAILHQVSPAVKHQQSMSVRNDRDSVKPWDKHVRLSGIESKLNYWSLVQKIIALWSKKKTTFQMWRSFCHAAFCIFSDLSLLMLQQSVLCGNCRGWWLQLRERRPVITERFMLEYRELWSFLSFK